MKSYQILLALVTIVVLCALDGHMTHLPAYGWSFRAVVELLVLGQVVALWGMLNK